MIKKDLLEVKCYEDKAKTKFLYNGRLVNISKKYAYVISPTNTIDEHFYDRLEVVS